MNFTLPALPYAYDALEPHLDALTMEIHHSRHHQTYVNGLNAAIEGSAYTDWSLERLLREIQALPPELQPAVRNHGGGHANHSLFWQVMAPAGGGEPEGQLSEAIAQCFGSFEQFKQQFIQAALSRFGSGWAWLVQDSEGALQVTSSANQDSPLMDGLTPILGLDVWEHAYYLRYQNKRPEYVGAFFNVINWQQVAAWYQAGI
ncbi:MULTISPECIES: superoxide dismutase [Rheinheimera]|uniref:Superoxide dismutase n=1 Tax=Rheinheimera aquimaris TaxID=412437 RepID=A0ABN1DQ49_9GAMM|nr:MULTISPECIES: superoxide dismutase [Rheinheimera]MCB5213462.1 superoxide dismutase [Rheinheimera aquimaris]